MSFCKTKRPSFVWLFIATAICRSSLATEDNKTLQPETPSSQEPSETRGNQIPQIPLPLVLESLRHPDPKTRIAAINAVSQVGLPHLFWHIAGLLEDADGEVQSRAVEALIASHNSNIALAALAYPESSDSLRANALRVLQNIQHHETVTALIIRLHQETDPARKLEIARTLCLLHWKRTPNSGARPSNEASLGVQEKWTDSDRIAKTLEALLETSTGQTAISLSIQLDLLGLKLDPSKTRLIALAKEDRRLWPALARQFAGESTIPNDAIPTLLETLREESLEPSIRGLAAQALCKTQTNDALAPLNTFFSKFAGGSPSDPQIETARKAFLEWPSLMPLIPESINTAASLHEPDSRWADCVLLSLATRPKNEDGNVQKSASQALEKGWNQSMLRRKQILAAMSALQKTFKPLEIALLEAAEDTNEEIRSLSRELIRSLKLNPDRILGLDLPTPKIASLSREEAARLAASTRGRVTDGERLFGQLSCSKCHTLSESEPHKGPFLGRLASSRTRLEIAAAILDPNKNVSPEFETVTLRSKDDHETSGFLLRESAEEVVVIDKKGEENRVLIADLAARGKGTGSTMPEGLLQTQTVRELSSLLEFLEAISRKEGRGNPNR